MNKMKRLLSMLLALAMVLGMSMTTFAANGVPEAKDDVEVSITGIGQGATVSLYQIARGEYGKDGAQGFIDYEWVNGTKFAKVNAPTADEINEIAKKIKAGTLTNEPFNGESEPTLLAPINVANVGVDGVFKYKATAGAYIAIIQADENDDSIYNPILLTASYVAEGAEAGNLEGHTIDATERYIGTEAVAKKTTPDLEKEIVGGTTTDDDRETASVGDVITYEIEPTMPSYPQNAKNKTLVFTDTMSDGLTFVFESLEIRFLEDSTKVIRVQPEEDGSLTFWDGEKKIATALKIGNGFSISFTYDNLVHGEETIVTPGAYTPVIRYKAVLNDNAVVGGDGNENNAKMFYANQPNTGSTFEPTVEKPEPEEGETTGIKKKEDSEVVYTYQLAFLKTGEGTDSEKLAGAVFGIYSDKACTNLVDIVKTNSNGYGVSSKVKSGTYYLKELLAPSGYHLNEKVYSIEATKTSATKTITTESREWKYTTEKPSDDAEQIGWIDIKSTPNVFYALDEYDGAAVPDAGGEPDDNMGVSSMPTGTSLVPAYVVYDNASVTTTTEITNMDNGGTAATLVDLSEAEDSENRNPGSIPNTKLSSLPSTGGIGTTIFTIAGCVIMVAAAGLFFVSRRKSSK